MTHDLLIWYGEGLLVLLVITAYALVFRDLFPKDK